MISILRISAIPVAVAVLTVAANMALASSDVSASPRLPEVAYLATPPAQRISWLSIGDSFASGEGASEASGYCQRSPNAAGPKAASILASKRGWAIAPVAFASCTGYLAADLDNSRDELRAVSHKPYTDDLPGLSPEPAADGEIANSQSLLTWAATQAGLERASEFDVVVSSLGGNDIGFADLIIGCLDPNRSILGDEATTWAEFAETSADDDRGCDQKPLVKTMRKRIDRLLDEDSLPAAGGGWTSLSKLYRQLLDTTVADDGVLVVLGYPRLITPSSDWGDWRGKQCNLVSDVDADALGQLTEYFDQQLRARVEALDPQRVKYVSRLAIFDDERDGHQRYHSLCGRGVEWINTPLLFLRDGTGRLERGFHPNDLGYLATAEAVAGSVELHFEESVRPKPSPSVADPTASPSTVARTQPSVRSSEAHFDIGDEFDRTCVVAWPTAPVRASDSIQMRMTCIGVPDQFLFVDVVYGDPDLAVTPSKSKMVVHGRIADVARSEYGFTTLVVEADDVECCQASG